jgi:hypothetical protein
LLRALPLSSGPSSFILPGKGSQVTHSGHLPLNGLHQTETLSNSLPRSLSTAVTIYLLREPLSQDIRREMAKSILLNSSLFHMDFSGLQVTQILYDLKCSVCLLNAHLWLI